MIHKNVYGTEKLRIRVSAISGFFQNDFQSRLLRNRFYFFGKKRQTRNRKHSISPISLFLQCRIFRFISLRSTHRNLFLLYFDLCCILYFPETLHSEIHSFETPFLPNRLYYSSLQLVATYFLRLELIGAGKPDGPFFYRISQTLDDVPYQITSTLLTFSESF